MERGLTVCTTPSERYNHGAAMFNDGTMYVYGGFSQRCVDYCDDLWFFDIYIKAWREIYYAGTRSSSVLLLPPLLTVPAASPAVPGALSKLYTETLSTGVVVAYSPADVPVDNSSSARWAGPGARWRHSMVPPTPSQPLHRHPPQ